MQTIILHVHVSELINFLLKIELLYIASEQWNLFMCIRINSCFMTNSRISLQYTLYFYSHLICNYLTEKAKIFLKLMGDNVHSIKE